MAEQLERARAQAPGRRQVRGGALLLEQCRGVGRERCPGDGGHREGRGRGPAARDAGDEECREDRRHGVDRVDERPGKPWQQPQQNAQEQRGRAHREGQGERAQRAVADPGQHIAPERVRAERVRPGRGLEPGAWCRDAADRGPGPARRRRAAVRRTAGAGSWDGARVGRCSEDSAPSRRAGPMRSRAVSRASPPANAASRTRARVPAWRTGRSCATAAWRVSRPSPGDVEDLLHGDRTAGEADDEQSEVREQSGHAAAQRLAGDAPARDSARGGRQCPLLGERARQQVVEHPPEQRARGQAERSAGSTIHWGPYQPSAGSQPSWTPTTAASTEAVRKSGSVDRSADPVPAERRPSGRSPAPAAGSARTPRPP